MLVFGTYVIYPIFSSIALSFHEWDGVAEKAFVGLANYRELIHADTFYSALKNNLIWLVLFGWGIFVVHIVSGVVLCVTIIGIPFGIQSFKLSVLALWPFGRQITNP